MIKCEVCESTDLFIGKFKNKDKYIGVCRECGVKYEVDNNMNLIMNDKKSKSYYNELNKINSKEELIYIKEVNPNSENEI